jgi:hypothetical protein
MRRGARGNYAADAASLPAHEQETKSLPPTRSYVSSEYAGKLKEGLVVSVGEAEGIIRTVPAQPVQITTDFDATAKSIAKMKNGDFYYP